MTRLFLTACCALLPAWAQAYSDNYLVGVGKHDITGAAAEVGMFGYANPEQKSSGIHNRQYARAYIIAEPDDGPAVVFVNVDAGALFQSVNQAVVERIKAIDKRFTQDNLVLSATHTHGGAGGQSHYALYNMTILGFVKENFDVQVNGIVKAITEAHENLRPGHVLIKRGELLTASKNRSQPAYDNNPAAERQRYSSSVDPEMLVLRLRQGNRDAGMISWFAVHPTSMSNSNTLLTSDNKGRAEWRFEERARAQGNPDFVASFAQSNHADTTPNLNLDGTGPTNDQLRNTEIIGDRQFDKALQLYLDASVQLTGSVDFRHQYNDFSKISVRPEFTGGPPQKTCNAALGNAFAAGAEDGRANMGFEEGIHGAFSQEWRDRMQSLAPPTKEEITCHAPKPILLVQSRAGSSGIPWSPEVLPASILRIGQFALLAVPGEFTVMSGRRLRETVRGVLGSNQLLVVAGMSNAYAGYVTTAEEYDKQHYEGGSTHFGRWTLAAYQQVFNDLAVALRDQQALVSTLVPRDLHDWEFPALPRLIYPQLSVVTPVLYDNPPAGMQFGEVDRDVNAQYRVGDTAQAVFWTGHPRNNLRTEGTFLEVQRKVAGNWQTVARDNDWSTEYHWLRKDGFWGTSQATLRWTIPQGTAPGEYRLKHYGDSKALGSGDISSFSGVSRSFLVQ
ncbi:neutral/alkaline ceramidase [Pseudomonas sp. J452]|uniref:neutral/alkaline ceramidase n=1 Tax=Pseudomonas sp. J452 TaxID=2898441 RepID=UPI0021ADF8F4|nr:neutral/alkaline ceramidase [Pseudomonas sp. J452]UUY08872.1 neutral/alkaline ceramidase [Pseudomonas sp. J452]